MCLRRVSKNRYSKTVNSNERTFRRVHAATFAGLITTVGASVLEQIVLIVELDITPCAASDRRSQRLQVHLVVDFVQGLLNLATFLVFSNRLIDIELYPTALLCMS